MATKQVVDANRNGVCHDCAVRETCENRGVFYCSVKRVRVGLFKYLEGGK